MRTFNCPGRSKFPSLENQYLALLIVYAFAMAEVNTIMEFLSCLASDKDMDLVWQGVAIILFGLSESKVRHVLRNKTVFAGTSPNTHVVIAASFSALCSPYTNLRMSVNQ